MYVILLRETIIEGGLFDDIGDTFNDAGNAIKGGFNSAGNALKDEFGGITAAGAATLSVIRGAANNIVYNATAIYNTIKDGVTQIGGLVNGLITGLLSLVLNGLAKAVFRLLSLFNLALASVNIVLDKATHFEQNVVNSINNSTTYTYNPADLVNEMNAANQANSVKGNSAKKYAEQSEKLDQIEDNITTQYLDGKVSEEQYKGSVAQFASLRQDLKTRYRIAPVTNFVLWEDSPEGKAKIAADAATARATAEAAMQSAMNAIFNRTKIKFR